MSVQSGVHDCDIFAAAYATALAFIKDPLNPITFKQNEKCVLHSRVVPTYNQFRWNLLHHYKDLISNFTQKQSLYFFKIVGSDLGFLVCSSLTRWSKP